MPRTQPKTMSKRDKYELLNELWSLVTLLETKDEIENFFRDLLSETEAIMLARRIRIARLLLEDKSYDDIRGIMNTGHTTIANVHRWLQGANEGYIKVLPKLERELAKKIHSQERQAKQKQAFSFEWLKKRYPLHFLLFNLLDASAKPIVKRKKRKK